MLRKSLSYLSSTTTSSTLLLLQGGVCLHASYLSISRLIDGLQCMLHQDGFPQIKPTVNISILFLQNSLNIASSLTLSHPILQPGTPRFLVFVSPLALCHRKSQHPTRYMQLDRSSLIQPFFSFLKKEKWWQRYSNKWSLSIDLVCRVLTIPS